MVHAYVHQVGLALNVTYHHAKTIALVMANAYLTTMTVVNIANATKGTKAMIVAKTWKVALLKMVKNVAVMVYVSWANVIVQKDSPASYVLFPYVIQWTAVVMDVV